jgi:hypothetical protein
MNLAHGCVVEVFVMVSQSNCKTEVERCVWQFPVD